MSDRLLAALRRKFKTPQEALQKLGLDAKLLETPTSPAGGSKERTTMATTKPQPSPTALLATGALRNYLAPRLAADAQIKVSPLLKGVTKANFKERIPSIVEALGRETRGRLAQDADIQDVAEILEAVARIEDDEPEMDADPMDPNANTMGGEGEGGGDGADDPAAVVARVKEMLKDKLPPEELARLDEAVGASMHAQAEGGAHDEEDDDMAGDEEEDDKMTDDEPPPFKGRPNPGGTMDRKAMDAAIARGVEERVSAFRREQRAIDEAREFVRPWVGGLPGLAADSAEDVYRAACRGLGMDVAQVKGTPALKLLIERTPKPGSERTGKRLGQDAAPVTGGAAFYARFPNAARIGRA